MLRLVVALPLLLLASCAFVHEGRRPEVAPLARPLFEEVSLEGLVYRDERVAARASTSIHSRRTGDASGYVSGPEGTAYGSLHAREQVVSGGSTVVYEAFDNDELSVVARRLLEDARIARRVVMVSDLRIEGYVDDVDASTGVLRTAWNVLDVVSFLALYGVPLTGSSEASVELRVYFQDELIGRYPGRGEASWTASFFLMGGARRESRAAACEQALRHALAELVRRPPDVSPSRPQGAM